MLWLTERGINIMKHETFKQMIDQTIFCAASGIIAPRSAHLQGGEVLLEKSKGKLMMAVSNKGRMGCSSRHIGNVFPDFGCIIMPISALQKIHKHKRDLPFSISVSDKEVHFHIGTKSISAVLIRPEFARFYRIPDETYQTYSHGFTVNRLSLLESLRIVSLGLELSKPAVFLELNPGTLTLRTGGEDCSVEDDVPSNYSGEKTMMEFFAKFFIEIFEHIDAENIAIQFNPGKPTVMILPEPERDYHFFLAQRENT